ncbi:MAG: pilin [Patescibacteria group bacterium]
MAAMQNRRERIGKKAAWIILGFLIFFLVASPAQAQYYGTVNPSDVGTQDCVGNGGKCLPPIGGVSVCPAGTNTAAGACPAGTICCKGTVSGTAGGSAEEAKGVCPAGQSYTKPGLGAVRCGANQCRVAGYLWFTDCLNESDCAANRGTTDGGNMAGCGEGTFCCRIKKNRCNDSETNPSKIYLCTSETECTSKGGKLTGGASGCNESGSYPKCCEFNDSNEPGKDTMLNAGEPLRGLTAATGGKTSQISRVARKYQNINSFCFTEAECAKVSDPGSWVSGQGCPSKGNTPQGYCKAPVPQYSLQYPLGGVTTISGLKNFIGLIFNYGMSIIIIVAAVLFIYGGFRYLFSAIADDIQTAKTIMTDSAIGLALGLGAYAILANVNFNTINLRSFDVFMINKLSFYDVLYCSDVKPAAGKTEVKFQDAGSPFAPLELDITKGYPLSMKDTKCGEEYFIEGSDSLSVCSGSTCGAGLCLNCSGGTSNCRSSSEKEHVCFDADIGGNIVMEGNLKAQDIEAQLFCLYKSGGDTKALAKRIGKAKFEGKSQSAAMSSGWVGSYSIKYSDKKEAIAAFKKDCQDKGAGNFYMGLTARFSGDETPFEGVLRTGLSLLPITGFGSGGIRSLDEASFVLGKAACSKNILSDDVSVIPYKGSFDDFDDAIAGAIIRPVVYWSIDEILSNIGSKTVIYCPFTLTGK